MFVTEQLNNIFEIIEDQGLSEKLQDVLAQKYIHLEAMLLRAKVLREFSMAKVQYIVQSEIQEEQANIAFLFAPFILANLNQAVIYNSPATPALLNILNHYYQADKKHNLKIDDVLSALNVYLDLSDNTLNETEFCYFSFIQALCRSDVSQLFLITNLDINVKKLAEIEQFFKVKIHCVATNPQDKIISSAEFDIRQLLFKNKNDQYVALCEKFSTLNAQLLLCYGLYNQQQAIHLIEDMFYTEHIYEKLSVYAEYIQTCLQHGHTGNNTISSI